LCTGKKSKGLWHREIRAQGKVSGVSAERKMYVLRGSKDGQVERV